MGVGKLDLLDSDLFDVEGLDLRDLKINVLDGEVRQKLLSVGEFIFVLGDEGEVHGEVSV